MNISKLLEKSKIKPVPLFIPEPEPDNTVILDLSVTNNELTDIRIEESSVLDRYIKDKMKTPNALYAFGGYMEDRAVYHRSPLFKSEDGKTRSIHLGIDLWTAANTLIRLPVDGMVHSFSDNDSYGDYGPTLIMKHEIDGTGFYTLYGHLSRSSLRSLKPGLSMKSGDVLAQIGNSHENGDWPPHLHFQVITRIGKATGDFPGVCYKDEAGIYGKICPSPSVFFRKMAMQ